MDSIKIFAKGWNFSQDGPGNRLLYHFQGCNLLCPWCSNPEGISVAGTILVKSANLTDTACPHGAIRNNSLDRTVCDTCTGMDCVSKNRNTGISFSAIEYSIKDISVEIEGARKLFHSGGGVTITGGEPTLQFKPLKELLTELRKMNIHSVIETNGTNEKLPELFGLLDILIIDLKHPDTLIHKKILGTGNENVIRNIKAASEYGVEMWIRIPLIPEFNDDEKTITGFVDFIKTINNEKVTVELLPYHEYGKVKWEQTGKTYTMPNKKISRTDIIRFENFFMEENIRVTNT